VNHGWRQGKADGFTIDLANGRWKKRDEDIDHDGDDDGIGNDIVNGVRLFVRDTRNLLLVRPELASPSEQWLPSLMHALRKGLQVYYQIEEQEIGADIIGTDEHRSILFWEAAEGGTGIWARLAEEPHTLAAIAREALKVCHFDPETGDVLAEHNPDDCVAACYECLLSYSNQQQHRLLDRRIIRDFLLEMAHASTSELAGGETREEKLERLLRAADPASPGESVFVRFLYHNGHKLPDRAQTRPADDVYVQPDFYFEREGIPGVCVFIDGSVHNTPGVQAHDEEMRQQLRDRGFRVVSIRPDMNLESQILDYPGIFS
jgi:hypothetical protein